ncbi:MAG: hypothetical protein UV95_C0001G0145 [Candidatus Falkowbacteria bacterium GW2011_GWF2_43_32]|nr:MAG: hypothetical protein UV95_C0001G0145 [Candidatus Falkowbacteria bacterium GW2011_GWF2_43_32]
MENSAKKIWIILGIVVLVALIVAIAVLQGKQAANKDGRPAETIQPAAQQNANGEVAPSKSVVSEEVVDMETLQEARPLAVGSSPITEDNIVVTSEGAPVKLNVMPSSPDAPKESAPIASADLVEDNAYTVKLSVSSAGFSPNTFTVKAGQLVNFVLTSTDEFTHVWRLEDPALIATALGVSGNSTRVKSWNAPEKGEYAFFCDIPGHKGRGETGMMIVE